MFILLSSDYSPRYKQDILRCLAAPVDTCVQFRYDKVHISDSVLEAVVRGTCEGSALVCSVATKGLGPLSIAPVRLVSIVAARVHGSTVSITFQVKDILFADIVAFTSQVDQMSNGESPRKITEDARPQGRYFFEIEKSPHSLKQGTYVEFWEQTVAQLREQLAYQDQPFFFTVIGIQQQGETLDVSRLHPLPKSLASGRNCELMVYHFQPRKGEQPNSKLELSVGPNIEIIVPPDTSIDSRYDLKIWRLRTSSSSQTFQQSWFRIRVADTWDLEVPVGVAGSWAKWVLRAFVTGILIGIPSAIAIAPQPLSLEQKITLYVLSLMFGFSAGLVATFKIDRLD